MFKGIISLFTSGVIFNPMVLLGVITGFYCTFTLDEAQLFSFFKDDLFYAAGLAISIVYNFVFKKTYTYGGSQVDWTQMFLNILGGLAKYVISAVLAVSFIWMISF